MYSTMKAVPGNLAEHAAVEEEMFLAAALFGLSGTPTGVAVLLKHPEAVLGALRLATGCLTWVR